jgi:hypothetical protein
MSPLGDGRPLDEPGDDVVGVRVPEIGLRDGHDPLPGACGLRQRIGRKGDPRVRPGLAPEDEVAGGAVPTAPTAAEDDPRDRHRWASGVDEISTRRAASIGHESKS